MHPSGLLHGIFFSRCANGTLCRSRVDHIPVSSGDRTNQYTRYAPCLYGVYGDLVRFPILCRDAREKGMALSSLFFQRVGVSDEGADRSRLSIRHPFDLVAPIQALEGPIRAFFPCGHPHFLRYGHPVADPDSARTSRFFPFFFPPRASVSLCLPDPWSLSAFLLLFADPSDRNASVVCVFTRGDRQARNARKIIRGCRKKAAAGLVRPDSCLLFSFFLEIGPLRDTAFPAHCSGLRSSLSTL